MKDDQLIEIVMDALLLYFPKFGEHGPKSRPCLICQLTTVS